MKANAGQTTNTHCLYSVVGTILPELEISWSLVVDELQAKINSSKSKKEVPVVAIRKRSSNSKQCRIIAHQVNQKQIDLK